ncbi:lytic transglycosylase domain-containing protein [Achromobacter aegrifaciens]|uniref:Lytic transglycosylase domain-containing protein n=1 Tax=Achromobacter aegrifaciens TaxID=1287736 RepID=A0ABU2DJQ5_ACHAE|nr:lytic transglycosylase domain-containing protein [Achromobacter aegrifaciens]MDR7948270.1 lytic transglycosylase domain-containing protein [Achromobacter aegrifaciens]
MDFPELARQCAPDVHISTLAAVVRHESGFNPLVIGVNSKPHRSIRPASKSEAVDEVRKLMDKGVDFDVGYGQINVRNWKWLGVTPETIFDPCVNLASAQRVLVNCYKRAAELHGPGQNALYAAFSCYNTGNLTAGFKNGYVGKLIAGAGLPVPAIVKDAQSSKAPPPMQPKTQESGIASKPDAFQKGRKDAFSNPHPDAFNKPSESVFGTPISRPRADSSR